MSAPTDRVMFIFPGQGSQYPGIGSDLYAEYATARSVYDRASEILGFDMAELSFRDPQGEINLTRNTQPVLLTHHIACLRVFQDLTDGRVTPHAAAGHSLGEYSALVAAGSLAFEDALRLVRQRGELMGTYGEGEMLAVPMDVETVRPLADKHFCGIGGRNLPDQTVAAGAGSDLDALEAELAELFPRKRTVRLKTEGAFHTYYMVEAARRFRPVLDEAEMGTPGCRVLSNYTGGFHEEDPGIIKARLFFQLFHPVNWIGCLETALADGDGITAFVEFGGGIGSGETPAEKRPNLESILKKATRRMEQAPAYFPAINTATLAETAAALGG
ncbi:ACP S-malonyltransferase [Thioalbus denitrificans]|uniref:Malonyl CoA-acyl carrier protein transacylase n=1 Tax=Thioalbus denitrificans TaxID=547122 RepID=A0A369BW61_9GAMM|nr:ACP S-malonyltransferase [Thioalbus denitrificans]RCX24806.1 [acyl-carrier-protein] S-malonyltransferase [Thioalbus denitrificans]